MKNPGVLRIKSDYGYEVVVKDKFKENFKKTVRFN